MKKMLSCLFVIITLWSNRAMAESAIQSSVDDSCPATHFEYAGRTFTLLFKSNVAGPGESFFRNMIENRRGIIVPASHEVPQIRILIIPRNNTISAYLRIEQLVGRSVLPLADNNKFVYLTKQWEQLNDAEKDVTMRVIAQWVIDTACQR
ncbi:MAG: hypothetical protein HY617_00680 [Candidatus Sungbacteria bacterium]|nr:hypothetical protein [Candidatus Sungbacteria bacterium]